jgi:hypothetical protein
MDLEEFPNCCGIQVLTDLDVDRVWGYDDYGHYGARPLDKKEVAEQLKDLIWSAKGCAGKLMATSNENQGIIRPFLRKFGFKKIRGFVNPNTDNYITVWELDLRRVTKKQLNRYVKSYSKPKAKAKK